MNIRNRTITYIVSLILGTHFPTAFADIKEYRWEYNPNGNDDLNFILSSLNNVSHLNLKAADFHLQEERDLSDTHFKTYVQLNAGVPVHGAVVRTWRDLTTGALVQMEAHLETQNQLELSRQKLKTQFPTALRSEHSILEFMNGMNTMKFVKEVVEHSEDRQIKNMNWVDAWNNGDLQRTIKVQSRHGVHTIVVSHFTKKIISSSYSEYPQSDINALVYPIYELTNSGTVQNRVPATLKNISGMRKSPKTDPYQFLHEHRYFENKFDPVRGATEEGRAQGYWSMDWILQSVSNVSNNLAEEDNSYANGGVYLEGNYATINIHPDAIAQFSKDLQFTPGYSSRVAFIWKEIDTALGSTYEMIPKTAYYGLPLADENSALLRPARILADQNPATYLNDGFDEIQVYYAVNTLMESFHQLGFTDPELSTRPFHAFLYDPDISMRDNAYYTNDTINFTTYSPSNPNMARDNSTIWHELGHGIMDRMMGSMLNLADTGGLSEGMADFLAQIIVEDVTNGAPFDGRSDFRIINRTGLYLTNEVHDDGEAYGGVMYDMLKLAMQKWGHTLGLQKMSDLTLETMRLTRNHPELTTTDWFEHLLYADSLGTHNGLRLPNEMHELITSALATRNFRFDSGTPAEMKVIVDKNNELTSKTPGSRNNPISHKISKTKKAEHEFEVMLKESNTFQFKYPVTVTMQFKGGALQGSIKWENEEQGPISQVLTSTKDIAKFKVNALECRNINREDGSCVDYAYILVKNNGEEQPVAKKRLYLRLTK